MTATINQPTLPTSCGRMAIRFFIPRFTLCLIALACVKSSCAFHCAKTKATFDRSLTSDLRSQKDPKIDPITPAPTQICEKPIEKVNGPFELSHLCSFWGRQPVLIKNAFDHSDLLNNGIWPSSEDIYTWATMPDDQDGHLYEGEMDATVDDFYFPVSSRIVRQEKPGEMDSFVLDIGPFPKSTWNHYYLLEDNVGTEESTSLEKDASWTLLVNDVDRVHLPLSDWMDETFAFLPRWRRDDAQISLAPTINGGIGPHVDNYDVFLIQVAGKRQWQVGDFLTTRQEMDSLIDGLDVRILNLSNLTSSPSIQPLESLEVCAGDLLYLPPRLIHWGTSLSKDCMTLSVGCRAPSASELTSKIAESMTDSIAETVVQRYSDSDLVKNYLTERTRSDNSDSTNDKESNHQEEQGYLPSIDETIKAEMKKMVLEAVQSILDDDVGWDEIVGRSVTAPTRPIYDDVLEDEDYEGLTTSEIVESVLEIGDGELYRGEGVSVATSRVSLSENDDGERPLLYRLFADGKMFSILDSQEAKDIPLIFSALQQGVPISKEAILQDTPISQDVKELLQQLLQEEIIFSSLGDGHDDDEDDDEADYEEE